MPETTLITAGPQYDRLRSVAKRSLEIAETGLPLEGEKVGPRDRAFAIAMFEKVSKIVLDFQKFELQRTKFEEERELRKRGLISSDDPVGLFMAFARLKSSIPEAEFADLETKVRSGDFGRSGD